MIVESDLKTLLEINNRLPDFKQKRTLEELQLKAGTSWLALIWQENKQNVGFKLGYKLDETCFYSWIGGVLPEYRGKGIAQKLLTYQEAWCKTQGYQSIRVKSTNLFRPMLTMLIKNEYNIIGTEHSKRLNTTKILFQKEI